MDERKELILDSLQIWLDGLRDSPLEIGVVVVTRNPNDEMTLACNTNKKGDLGPFLVDICERIVKDLERQMRKDMDNHGRTHGVDPPSSN